MLIFYPYHLFLSAMLLVHITISARGENRFNAENTCVNYISVQGSTNIHEFCLVNYNLHIKPLSYKTQNNIICQNIKVPVYEFTNTNNRLLQDFYKMVKASQYPAIKILLQTYDKINFDKLPGITTFKTRISIAGVTHNYAIPCKITRGEKPGLIVIGKFKIKLSDFNMTPPEKVFGVVKVNNEVFINFAFKMNSEEILSEKVSQ